MGEHDLEGFGEGLPLSSSRDVKLTMLSFSVRTTRETVDTTARRRRS